MEEKVIYILEMSTKYEFTWGIDEKLSHDFFAITAYNNLEDARLVLKKYIEVEQKDYGDWLNKDLKEKGAYLHHKYQIRKLNLY